REAHHVVVNVARLAVLEAGDGALRVAHHRVRVRAHAVMVERRLSELPLPAPEIALAREEPPPHDDRQVLRVVVLPDVVARGLEDLLDRVRVIQEIDRLPRQGEANDVPVLPRDALEEPERVADQLDAVPEEGQPARTGGLRAPPPGS